MGVFDFLTGQSNNNYTPVSPEQQGWLAFTQAQLGQPSRYKIPAWQLATQGILGGAQAYKQANDVQQLQQATQAQDAPSLMAALSKIQDPDIQKTILSNRLAAMTPKYEMTKDAFGNPIAVNSLDPTKSVAVGGQGMFGGMGGSLPTGNNSSSSTDSSGTATGDEFLKTLPPQIGTQVKSIAEGRMPIPGGMALKTPYWQQMLQAVSQYDPSFDAVNYNARAKTRNDFTAGKSAQNITALNTAMGHLSSLSDSANALNNTSYPMWNKVANTYENAIGDPRVKEFNLNKDAVADEFTRVFRGSGGSVSDINSWKEQLDAASSPEQFKGVMQKGVDLLNSRLDSLGQQYNQGMGTTKQGIELLSPKAQDAYQKLTGQPPGETNASGDLQADNANQPIKAGVAKITMPTAQAIAYLKSNPKLAPEFEAKYGISAKNFLGM